MSRHENDAVQAIKARLSLADLARRYVELRSVGSRLMAPCPFHQETKPSFSINEEAGTFYCFGCQAAGDIFDFYGRINGLDFRESLRQLAEEAGVRLETYASGPQTARTRSRKQEMLKMHDVAAAHFAANLEHSHGEVCRGYMAERGLSPEIRDRFGLGWSLPEWQALQATLRRTGFAEDAAVECGLLTRNAKGGVYDRFRARLMFPIRNLSGRVVAFGGRVLPSLAREEDAKYINSSDSPIYKKGEHLYGLFHARSSIMAGKSAMLTEGYMDVLTLHQFGYTQAVGVLGTALTPEQVKRLSGFCSHIELLFDGDNAGRKAALRSCEMLLTRGLSCKVVLIPDTEDIDSLLRSRGKDAFEALRRAAPDGLAFCLSVLHGMAPKDAVEWARSFLSRLELPELLHRFASELSSGLGLEESALRGGPQTGRKARGHGAPPSPESAARRILPEREIMTFAVRYPHRLSALRDCGADLMLTSPWAHALWDKLERFSAEEIFTGLNEQEKKFWLRCRDAVTGAPALDGETRELNAVRQMLDRRQKTAHSASVAAALRRGTADYDTEKEYICALNAARGRRSDPE